VDGAFHDLGGRAIVTEVNYLGTGALENTTHDVDGRVVTVEEGGGSHDPDGVLGTVSFHLHNLTWDQLCRLVVGRGKP
jgi:hypothetical protein